MKALVTLTDFSAQQKMATVRLELVPSAEMMGEKGIGLDTDIEVEVSPAEASGPLAFSKGQPLHASVIRLPVTGSMESWPLDRYLLQDLSVVVCAPTCGEATTIISADLKVAGGASGWDMASQFGDGDFPVHAVTLRRTPGVIVFAIVVVAVLVLNTILVLWVAVLMNLQRRKYEASLTGWMAAMLFATVPIRSFFPGSPPIGSWIDFTVVLWAVVGLSIGLGLYIHAWSVHTREMSAPVPASPGDPPMTTEPAADGRRAQARVDAPTR